MSETAEDIREKIRRRREEVFGTWNIELNSFEELNTYMKLCPSSYGKVNARINGKEYETTNFALEILSSGLYGKELTEEAIEKAIKRSRYPEFPTPSELEQLEGFFSKNKGEKNENNN